MLQQLALAFDPLGLLSPILIKGKNVLQGNLENQLGLGRVAPLRLSLHGVHA